MCQSIGLIETLKQLSFFFSRFLVRIASITEHTESMQILLAKRPTLLPLITLFVLLVHLQK